MRSRAHVEVAKAQDVVSIRVCTGSGCAMNGSLLVATAFEQAIREASLENKATVVRTGCHGLCAQGPVVVVGENKVFYPMVTEEGAREIVSALAEGREVVEHLLFEDPRTGTTLPGYADIPFNRAQTRIVLRNCGMIDPESIDEALRAGAYEGLRRVLEHVAPEDVIEEITASGLRGRGGAGFPTGLKWRLTRDAPGDEKYVICNADEGDPGAFMDRSILEGDPHSVLEGMAIAAYAIGASRGYVYIRAEYPLAVKRLRRAIEDATSAGFLGDDILGSGFGFSVKIKEGAGAFVCGEETALIASIEGQRGMPRPRPPYPAQSGLWGKPTCINNVETLANVSWIITHGAEAYAALGTDGSKGTKVFALTGKTRYSGLIEVPMGSTVRHLVEEIGGCEPGSYKAVQIGGPSGGCLPSSLMDTQVDYEALAEVGCIVGSGGVVVADHATCMVDLARFFLSFTQTESCGKCVPCRVGTKRMLESVTRITEGEAELDEIDRLEELAHSVKKTSLCGLGQTAPNPVLTTLRYFRHEYEEHIRDGHCRAGTCTALLTFTIDQELCRGCGVCVKHCPAEAISGVMKEPHSINTTLCVKCGQCLQHCPFDAIQRR
ncbi:MAG: NADH-quinone oxidoreductase subunit NuoF [Coriobacteriia bacterium]